MAYSEAEPGLGSNRPPGFESPGRRIQSHLSLLNWLPGLLLLRQQNLPSAVIVRFHVPSAQSPTTKALRCTMRSSAASAAPVKAGWAKRISRPSPTAGNHSVLVCVTLQSIYFAWSDPIGPPIGPNMKPAFLLNGPGTKLRGDGENPGGRKTWRCATAWRRQAIEGTGLLPRCAFFPGCAPNSRL
jgi:hypothetical protein